MTRQDTLAKAYNEVVTEFLSTPVNQSKKLNELFSQAVELKIAIRGSEVTKQAPMVSVASDINGNVKGPRGQVQDKFGRPPWHIADLQQLSQWLNEHRSHPHVKAVRAAVEALDIEIPRAA